MIPLVVVLALTISLAEITFALPAHLIGGIKGKTRTIRSKTTRFLRRQKGFGILLKQLLGLRYGVLAGFLLLLGATLTNAPLPSQRTSSRVKLPQSRPPTRSCLDSNWIGTGRACG